MLNTVIVGVDGLERDRDAIALARALAPGADLVLACAYPYDTTRSRFALLGYGTALREQAEHDVKQRRREAGIEDAPIELIPDTSPGRALHRLAERLSADLIVVGSPRHGKVNRALLGDVARAVLHGAPCPVAVAPSGFTPSGPLRRVGVAFDDSPESYEALRFAADLASATGGPLRLRMAVQAPVQPIAGLGLAIDYEALREELLDEADSAVEKAARSVGGGIEIDAAAVTGTPAEALGGLCVEVDVIVCGSRGWGGVRRVMLGSTSDHLIHHAPCPVIVVPRSAIPEVASAEPAVLTHVDD